MESDHKNTAVSFANIGQLATLPAKAPHTYLAMATNFAAGAQYLLSSPQNEVSATFLCAQATECALKAYLSRGGDEERLKSRSIRHNLVKLWDLAITEGLNAEIEAPQWLIRLGDLHDKPYHLRYLSGVHGLTLPLQQDMVNGSMGLIEIIRHQIKNKTQL